MHATTDGPGLTPDVREHYHHARAAGIPAAEALRVARAFALLDDDPAGLSPRVAIVEDAEPDRSYLDEDDGRRLFGVLLVIDGGDEPGRDDERAEVLSSLWGIDVGPDAPDLDGTYVAPSKCGPRGYVDPYFLTVAADLIDEARDVLTDEPDGERVAHLDVAAKAASWDRIAAAALSDDLSGADLAAIVYSECLR